MMSDWGCENQSIGDDHDPFCMTNSMKSHGNPYRIHLYHMELDARGYDLGGMILQNIVYKPL